MFFDLRTLGNGKQLVTPSLSQVEKGEPMWHQIEADARREQRQPWVPSIFTIFALG